MVSPTSPNKLLAIPVTGTEPGTWGDDVVNNTFLPIDKMLGGTLDLTLSNSDVLLTAAQAQNCIIRLSGILTVNVLITNPSIGFYVIDNKTTGSFSVTVSNGVGTPVTITQGQATMVVADATNGVRILQQPASVTPNTILAGTGLSSSTVGLNQTLSINPTQAYPVSSPQGRLTPTSGTPVISSGVTSTSTIYWTPTGGYFPVYDGTGWVNLTVSSDLTLTLTAAASANSIVDIFGISSSGSAVIAFGPSWQVATPGSGSRGTGAGTTQLQRLNGLLVNAVSINLTNGATVYNAVPASQATYLGSVWIDSVSGQTTCHTTWGQSRKFGISNAYNRSLITLIGGDSTASWSYGVATWRPSNGSTANSISTFDGIAGSYYSASFNQNIYITGGYTISTGIGINSTTSPSGFAGTAFVGSGTNGHYNSCSMVSSPPALGITTLTMLEIGQAGSAAQINGTEANMTMAVQYMC
jgi:hypothetical protein